MAFVSKSYLVNKVKMIEYLNGYGKPLPRKKVMENLWKKRWDFHVNKTKGTYLLIRPITNKPKDAYRMDCHHFISAASTAYTEITEGKEKFIGGSEKEALFMGIGNEFFQAITETTNKGTSAFSEEDLMSNRLGTVFTKQLKRLPESKFPVYKALDKFLTHKLKAVPLGETKKFNIRKNTGGDIFKELMGQIGTILFD